VVSVQDLWPAIYRKITPGAIPTSDIRPGTASMARAGASLEHDPL